MKKHLARPLAAVILAVTLFLTSCSGSGANVSPETKKLDHIFKKEVQYEAYTPLDDLYRPIGQSNVLDHVQIEKTLYIIGDGAVYSLNTESGESPRLFETNASEISARDNTLYLFDSQSAVIASYSLNGGKLNETAVEGFSGLTSCGFEATKNYWIVMQNQDRNVQLLSVKKDENSVETAENFDGVAYEICSYKEDKVFVFAEDAVNFSGCVLSTYDAMSDKLEKQGSIVTGSYTGASQRLAANSSLLYGGAKNFLKCNILNDRSVLVDKYNSM